MAVTDQALLQRLQHASDDPQTPRYGAVQIEGYMREGTLIPLIIRPLE
jgi:hypothetical protein